MTSSGSTPTVAELQAEVERLKFENSSLRTDQSSADLQRMRSDDARRWTATVMALAVVGGAIWTFSATHNALVRDATSAAAFIQAAVLLTFTVFRAAFVLMPAGRNRVMIDVAFLVVAVILVGLADQVRLPAAVVSLSVVAALIGDAISWRSSKS